MKKPRAKASEKTMPVSGRAVWTGQLRLALVTIPVQLVSAVKTGARLSFHQIDAKSHKRIRYEKTAPGFEISKGNYVLVTEDDLESVKLEARRTIDLVQFVGYDEIDPLYFEKPYYVLPDGKLAQEAYGVVRDAMRAAGRMALGQFVMRGREYVAAIKPCGRGLLLETLRFSDEVRASAPFFADMGEDKAEPELLEMAQDLISKRTKKFEPGQFHDHYTAALRSLIESKGKHQVPVDDGADEAGEARGNVVDLVAALRRSVAQTGAAATRAAGGEGKPRKASAPASASASAPASKKRKAG
jgi:DNA end-binding protein Ku